MADILIISPHLDDAVLSLGSFIGQQASQGKKVKVITVFTHGNNSSNHPLRKENDALALSKLGATFLHLNFTDAPFRSDRYNAFATLMFHHEETKETQLHPQLYAALHQILLEEKPDRCFFPLGVGGHVDHNVVFHVGAALSKLNLTECLFYEDAPYNLVTNWSRTRFAKIFGHSPIAYETPTGLKAQPFPFLQNYLMHQEDVETSEKLYQQETEYCRTIPSTETNRVQKTTNPLQKNRKQYALQAYSTEYKTLFGERAERMLKDEIYWKLY